MKVMASYLTERLTVAGHNAGPELTNRDVTIHSAAQVIQRRLGHQHDRSSIRISHLGNHNTTKDNRYTSLHK